MRRQRGKKRYVHLPTSCAALHFFKLSLFIWFYCLHAQYVRFAHIHRMILLCHFRQKELTLPLTKKKQYATRFQARLSVRHFRLNECFTQYKTIVCSFLCFFYRLFQQLHRHQLNQTQSHTSSFDKQNCNENEEQCQLKWPATMIRLFVRMKNVM